MVDKLKRIYNFCQQYSFVVCYGAAGYGQDIKRFLEYKGIKVKCFLVSQKNVDEVCGIPVYAVDDIPINLNDCGIILSLSEKFHKDVKLALCKNNLNNEIYDVNMSEFSCVRSALYNIQRREHLMNYVNFSVEEKKEYEQRINIILNDFIGIKLRNIDMRYLGCMGVWPYYVNRKEDDGYYSLYYPITLDESLISPNECLLEKLSGARLGLITRKNIRFWQYSFCYYSSKFVIEDEFCSAGWNDDFKEVSPKIDCSSPCINLTHQECIEGRLKAETMGLKSENEFVCVSSRDLGYGIDDRGAYLPTAKLIGAFRNSDIESYKLGIKFLADNNIKAVRMGANIEKNLSDDNVINYAGEYYDSFMDLYLTSKCKFFVANLSGILAMPILFAKPMLVVNAALLTTRCDAVPLFNNKRDIVILKKMWDTINNRFLTIREMLDIEVNSERLDENIVNNTFNWYMKRKIVPVDNSPEEILEAFIEMNKCVNESINSNMFQLDNCEKNISIEDMELQERYEALINTFPLKDNVLSNWRIGTAFLKRNSWLLD